MVKIAVLAPKQMASVRKAVVAYARSFQKRLRPNRMSRSKRYLHVEVRIPPALNGISAAIRTNFVISNLWDFSRLKMFAIGTSVLGSEQ
jgi:hypothetical protein